ncbi:sialic acid-binding Ig-like lectin 13 [Mustelus asterias]
MIGKSYFFLSLLQVGLSQEWKDNTPREVPAQEGSCVQIPCHYTYPSHLANHSRVGIWYNNEIRNVSSIAFHSKDHNRELSQFRHRTRLSGDLRDGDCSLIINNVTRGDAGPYYFRIEFENRNNYSFHPVTQLQVSAEPSQEWKGDTPQKVTAQEGSCVQIPCQYSYPSCLRHRPRDGVWYNGKGQSSSSVAFYSKDHNSISSRFRNRTRLSGDLKDGNCSLIINNVRRGDAGPYFFRIEFDGKNRCNYYPVTQLHVSDFTDKPTIFPAEIIAGKRVNISCTFNTTCNGTAPVVTWDTPTDVPGSVSNTVTQHGVTLTYTSVLTLIPSLKHHGHNLTCRVRYPSVSSERILVLTVQYAPQNLSITLFDMFDASWINITEGNSTVIICSVESFPASNLTWRHLNVTMNRTRSNNELWLVIRHVTSWDTGDYQCVAENEHGAVEGSITITVELHVKPVVQKENLPPLSQVSVVHNTCGIDCTCTSSTMDHVLMNSCTLEVSQHAWNESCCSCSHAHIHGHTNRPDNLLYANINFLVLPSGDGTVHRSEVTEYAQLRFQRN